MATIVTNMWKPRGNTYYSSTKNETIALSDMNYMHLVNAMRSIEDQARATKRELKTTDPEAYAQLEGLALPTLAATLCPKYLDLVEEYDKRNSSNMSENKNTQEQTQQAADQITARINELKNNARSSLETVRQLAPSSVISDLDDIARLMDELDTLFEQQAKAQAARAEQVVTSTPVVAQEKGTSAQQEATVVTVAAAEGPQNSATTIDKFKFSENHQVNVGVRRKIKKYMLGVRTVADMAAYTVFDLLTLFTGEQVYNIAHTLARENIPLGNTNHRIYLNETDIYPRRVEYFIKKPRFDRAGFEKRTNLNKLGEIPYVSRDAWIAEADRLHNNIQDRARDRYKILSNYVAGIFSMDGQTMDEKAWIDTLLGEDCSQLTRDEVHRWFFKGTA